MAATIRNIVTGFAATLLIASLPATAFAADPTGTWVRPSTGTQVVFYNCGPKLCARITAAKKEELKKNVGTVIVKGADKSSDNTWKGDLLDVESGKTYSGVFTLESANALSLKGCVAAVICRGETWQRVK